MTPYDIDRFGALLPRFTPRQADLLMVIGTVTVPPGADPARVYDQMAEPQVGDGVRRVRVDGRVLRQLHDVAGHRSHRSGRHLRSRLSAAARGRARRADGAAAQESRASSRRSALERGAEHAASRRVRWREKILLRYRDVPPTCGSSTTTSPTAATRRRARRSPRCTPGSGHRDGQGVEPARPRRRGVPDRHEVGLPAQEHRQADLPALQRRRERAGHLQGPRRSSSTTRTSCSKA